jgi:hypothetical protein
MLIEELRVKTLADYKKLEDTIDVIERTFPEKTESSEMILEGFQVLKSMNTFRLKTILMARNYAYANDAENVYVLMQDLHEQLDKAESLQQEMIKLLDTIIERNIDG